jgi:RHS repeat-associated protein
MTYDGDGNRLSKTVGGTTTYYLVDDANPSGYSQVLEEYRGTTLTNVYNYGLNLISQRTPNVRTNYFISDGHGSTRMLTDNSGTVVNVLAYDAYGNLIASNGVLQTDFLYSGQQLDTDLGLYLNRARYLDTGTGRFWTADSTEGDNEDPISLHKYLYAEDGPIDNVDPSGNMSMVELNVTMGLIAGLGAIYLGEAIHTQPAAVEQIGSAAWAETRADGGSAVAAAESVLSMAQTSIRDLIKDAKDILRKARKNSKNIKVVPVPRFPIQKVADHVAAAQAAGQPKVLIRAPDYMYAINRSRAIGTRGSAGSGYSWDEYPFAASRQGGLGADVVKVPRWENSTQGAIIRWSYAYEHINVGDPYLVIVIP